MVYTLIDHRSEVKIDKTQVASDFTDVHIYLTINERGWVSYEELWRSKRVLSVEAVGRGG